jgi:hypothetical protein
MTDLDAGAAAPTSEAVAPEAHCDAVPAPEITTEATPSMEDTMLEVWNKHHHDDSFPARDARDDGEGRRRVSPDQAAEAAREQGGPEPATAIAAPLSWTGEMKAKWASLPPEFRDLAEYAAKRDREQHDAISRAGQQVKTYEPIGRVIEQFADTFQRNNLPPAEAIGRMLRMERWLDRDAKSAIAELARAYAIDLRDLTDQQTAAPAHGQEGTQAADPRVSTLAAVLAETQRELRQVTSHLTAQQRAEHDAREAALARQIADFAKDKPHFEAVRRHMGALMAVDEGLSLDDAYERATYALPDIRNRILQDQRNADEDRRAQEVRRKAAAARNAAQVNVRSTGTAGASPKSMDDTLQEIARRAYA